MSQSTRSIGAWAAALLASFLCAICLAETAPARLTPIVLTDSHEPVRLDRRARFFVDDARRTTPAALETAASIPWQLREAGQTYRIDGKALWFEFEVVNRSSHHWFIELGSSGIDRVQFFWKRPDGTWVVQEAGDTRAVSDWPLPGRLPAFELAGPQGTPVQYWIRIEHVRVDFASPLVLYDESTLFVQRETEQFLLGGYFSLAALIALVSIANALVYRDRNFGAYAVYVISLAAGQLGYLGVGAQHVWNSWLRWNEMASFVLPDISAAAALWFARTVTEPQRYSRALDLIVWALIAMLLVAVTVDAIASSRESLALTVGLAGLALVLIAILVGVVWFQGDDQHIRLIALGFLPVLVMAVFPILRGFNLIPVSLLTRYGISIGAAIEMPILFYALNLRGSRRREASARAAGLSRNDALTGLAHTRTFLQRLEDALQRCATLKHACGLMVVKIANYDMIIAEYGRDAAERALVVAASLLRNVTTDVDMAARVGDHAFAVLLEGPATPDDVTSRAQQLVASGLRPTDALPIGVVLKFHVAEAMLPDRQLDAQGSLGWLTEAVNAIPADARKLIRPLNF